MFIIIALIVALVAAIISAAAYPRPVAYPAAGTAAAALTIVAALLVRDYAAYFAAVAVLALAVVVTGWAVAEALGYADRKRDEAERLAPPPRRPVLAERRYDLGGHTITVEDGPDGRTVVERSDGWLMKVVRTPGGLASGETVFMVARAAAGTYGARYVPDLHASSSSDRHDLAVENIARGAR